MEEDNIHFHWRLIQGGEESYTTSATQNDSGKAAWPDLKLQSDFCKEAEKLGIESVLVDINYGKPDPTLLTLALTKEIKQLGFIIAVRSGLLSPTLFVQQINTLSTFSKGRLYINVVAGHSPTEQQYYGDFLTHNERYERTDDFLSACLQFWDTDGPVNVTGKYLKIEEGLLNTPYVSEKTKRPFIFIGGGSQPAIDLSLKYGDCWIQLGDTPGNIQKKITPILTKGKVAGLRLSVICRSTNAEAILAANKLLEETKKYKNQQNGYVTKSDSKSINKTQQLAKDEWPSPNLWTGVVKTIGPTGIAIVGSYKEVAEKFIEYKEVGVTHFILSGWPKLEEMNRFGTHVIPIIRKMEKRKSLTKV
ncbi:LLM class flavin-dependent oxidoreductase [Aquimarina sp. 2201CG14-23]|uniref:LLM class flavin-dependent oxidoreductase n=1 Tax=Aquimarina mycalae TaxID=3040073 RepID=UPI002477CF51|nr:LLM class flavin-dependent oxidoreductase [Aquimarina sp. 2201CG14-23]MDH7448107.1 LLM class flavin-dependent oxidoreductase [Aquimarina sp. 2201CG14-23]